MTPTDIAISVRSLSTQDLSIPAALWTGAAVLHRIHAIWQRSLYFQNLPGFLSGAIYKTISGDSPWMTWPTIPFFIIARFLNLFEQEDEWNGAKKRWIDALKCIQPVHLKIEPFDQIRLPFVSKYTATWLKIRTHCILIRTQRIAIKTLDLLWQSFKLIMRVMDVVELVTMDWSSLPTRSAWESGMNVPRCLAFLDDPENKEAFFSRLNNKKIGLKVVGEFYLTDALKVEDCVKNLFNYVERGLFYYKKYTGWWSDAVIFLIKQGVRDWSPECVKKFLEEPDSKEFLKKIQGNIEKINMPPLEVISFVSDLSKNELLPIKKNKPEPKIAARPMKPMDNVYCLNSKKIAINHSPQIMFTF